MEIGELGSLEQLLYRDWKRIIVDAGSAGNVSVKARDGELVILADERMPVLNFGRNKPDRGGEVIPIRENVGELTLRMQDMVDYVLCVAPDPRDLTQIAAESETILKKHGKMLFVVDLYSNLRREVDPAIEETKARYRGSIYRVHVRQGNPNAIVRHETGLNTRLQSRLKIDIAKVVIVERRQ